MPHKVYEFDFAIVRRPAASVTAGMRAIDRGNPTHEGVSREHEAYVAALRAAGIEVEVLEREPCGRSGDHRNGAAATLQEGAAIAARFGRRRRCVANAAQ
jgi:N-dimethylarginine dimethylaminohydrolase